MKTLYPSFESFLRDIHSAQYSGTDDDMPKAFDLWLDSQDIAFFLKQADNFAGHKLVEQKKFINQFMADLSI